MRAYKFAFLIFTLIIVFGCKQEKQNIDENEIKVRKPNKVVLISINAPEKYSHLILQDSIGKKMKDSIGPKAFWNKNGFTYLDYMNNPKTWTPKPNVPDTLTIECFNDYIELSTKNFFTSIDETFLVKNGDTIIFNYEHQIPNAKITNRIVNDEELNYNSYRLRKLFNNKYSSHYMVFGNLFFNENINEYEQKSIDYYKQAKIDFNKEIQLLDSLRNSKVISQINYSYRKDALTMLMEKHKKIKHIKNSLESNKITNNENIEQEFGFNLKETDSLMKFSYFRDYLINISQYNLGFIEENNTNSGGFYIDSRIRFDSIIKDRRFNQTAKNFLLFDSYDGIGKNFKVKDKEKYFTKLQENTSNRTQLNKLEKDYKLDFSKSDQLILIDSKNDTLTLSNLLEKNKGKWIYIDFWASWCAPCLKSMPASRKLKEDLKNENVELIYLALNDNKAEWKKMIKLEKINDSQNYFIENGNTSKVIEELGIKSIPHYLIYNPNGELINGFANRPEKGAKEQLKRLIDAE